MAKNTPTLVYSHVVKGHLVVESGLERELVEELDGDPSIRWMVTQPAELHLRPDGGKLRRHTPDLLVMHDAGITVWDVRPVARQDERFAQMATWTAQACQRVGWEYRLFAGHPPVRRVNTMWLAAYRRPAVCIEAYADVIRAGLQDGSIATVGHVAAKDSGYGQLIAAMYHLLWAHRLECDLDQPITSRTRLHWVD
ncbi:MAG: TnsA-like heteromeric transposase endonuclease subunit [Micropruina sp.]|nr:TnsA-like heteromeric transposase endonuclease subunit [Micropruina sp.]